ALLLLINPLYRLHARRAMSDVPAEALVLATLAVALWGWRQALRGRLRLVPSLATAGATGVLGGLAVLAKLSGLLGMMVLASWVILGAVLPRFPIGRRVAVFGCAVLAGAGALATFVALNPLVTARPRGPLAPEQAALARQEPWRRIGTILAFRADVSRD